VTEESGLGFEEVAVTVQQKLLYLSKRASKEPI